MAAGNADDANAAPTAEEAENAAPTAEEADNAATTAEAAAVAEADTAVVGGVARKERSVSVWVMGGAAVVSVGAAAGAAGNAGASAAPAAVDAKIAAAADDAVAAAEAEYAAALVAAAGGADVVLAGGEDEGYRANAEAAKVTVEDRFAATRRGFEVASRSFWGNTVGRGPSFRNCAMFNS